MSRKNRSDINYALCLSRLPDAWETLGLASRTRGGDASDMPRYPLLIIETMQRLDAAAAKAVEDETEQPILAAGQETLG